jgi:hypothetical protein
VPASQHRSTSRSLSAVIVSVLMLATVAALGATPAQAKRIASARTSYALAIEPLAGYQPQTTCSPFAKPGVVDLSKRLLRAFPTTRSLGIVRACSVGGQSEHKEGRAFDWGGLNSHSAKDRARVARFVHWLDKPDKYGNPYANVRRLGIQYLIWNHKIWGSYAASSGWRKYTGADPHTNHVHISFTWAGARKNTSFWTGKVGNVAATPTPTKPPTTPPPPGGGTTTPRPEPVPATTLKPGPALADETVSLAGTSAGVTTVGALTAGQPYLIEASGTWKWGTRVNEVADAECSTAPHDKTWRRDRSVDSTQPMSDHLDLYVDGNDLMADPDTDSGDGCDTATHTYRWTYTPTRTGRVKFASWDPTTLADNSGALTIRVISSTPVDQMTWSVPATAGAGVTSPGALAADETYLVTVSGTVAAGGGVLADAECSTTPTDPVWRRNRVADPAYPGAERLDVLVDKQASTMSAVTDPTGSSCDVANHVYRSVLRPWSTRPINLRVDDLTPQDNTGALTVTVTRVVQPTGPETIALDTKVPAGARSARIYLAGSPLRITAVGTYTSGPGTKADPECTSPTAKPNWTNVKGGPVDGSGNTLGDVTVAGHSREWQASGGKSCDPATHTYTLTYTPSTTGPLSFGVADTLFSDNAGTMALTVVPVG